jgi:hypothetical protein
MMRTHVGHVHDVYDATPEFMYAVSLLAALEGATGATGHQEVLPYLGMARAELVDFGQRRPVRFVEIDIDDFHAGLAAMEQWLTVMLLTSPVLQHSLRLEAARRLVRCAIGAVGGGC